MELFAYFTKMCQNNNEDDNCNENVIDLKSFNAKFKIILKTSDLNQLCEELFNELLKKVKSFKEGITAGPCLLSHILS